MSEKKAGRVVGLAASAGGLNALIQVISKLPGDLPAAVVVVQHLEPTHRSMLASILDRRTDLLVTEARDGDVLADGRAYVAPPNRHLLVNVDRSLSLTQSELVHFVRIGFSNKEIAARLDKSVRTVKTQLTSVYRKCGVRSRSRLLALMMPRLSYD